ncbi:MAG TPA: hypothetical protein VM124_00665 [Candidatus Limnocylindrales bacterium]|nr:hypothetical protein [Candidatus Limnocylindrales bacterium]
MSDYRGIPVRSREVTDSGRPHRRGNRDERPVSRYVMGATALMALVSLTAVGIKGLVGGESAPRVTVLSELPGCEKGQRDSKPQPTSYYVGQTFTIEALGHTVKLAVEDGSRLRQEGGIDNKVSLQLGDGPQPEPGQTPVGPTLVYDFDHKVDVTVSARPNSNPLLTDVSTSRSC